MRTPGYEFFKPELQAAKQAGALVTSEVELFLSCALRDRGCDGSDGKTTTTTLIAKMFEAAGRKVFLGGNIGAACCPSCRTLPRLISLLWNFQLPADQHAQESQGGGCDQRDPQPPGPPQGYAGVY